MARGGLSIPPIEIKNTSIPGAKHFSGLRSFLEEYPKTKSYLACDVPRSYVEAGVKVINYSEFLKNLFSIVQSSAHSISSMRSLSDAKSVRRFEFTPVNMRRGGVD